MATRGNWALPWQPDNGPYWCLQCSACNSYSQCFTEWCTRCTFNIISITCSAARKVLIKLFSSITNWESEDFNINSLFAIIFFFFFSSYSSMAQQPDVLPRPPDYNLSTHVHLFLHLSNFLCPIYFWNPLLPPSILFQVCLQAFSHRLYCIISSLLLVYYPHAQHAQPTVAFST